MGYDLYWEEQPDAERQEVARLRELFQQAVEERKALPREERGQLDMDKADQFGLLDSHAYVNRSARFQAAQDRVEAAYDAMDAAHESYFRASIGGMSELCDIMAEIGMIFAPAEQHPEWPDPGDYGTSWDDVEVIEDPEGFATEFAAMSQSAYSAALSFRSTNEDVMAWHGDPNKPGIPSHKFGSNDDWHVLPAEAEAAVKIYTRWRETHSDAELKKLLTDSKGRDLSEFWGQWISFLAKSVKHGGFRVR